MSTEKAEGKAPSNGVPSKDQKGAEATALASMNEAKAKFDKLYTLINQRKAVTTHLERNSKCSI